MRRPFNECLGPDQLMIWDGGMGTMLYARGIFINTCFEQVSVTQPELIQAIHREYIEAGAQVLETNTFGANRYKLKAHGLADQVHLINRRGAELAREVAGQDLYVAGSIGPLGVSLEPLGNISLAEAQMAFEEQVEPLLAGGVDLFILETFTHMEELTQAVAAIRAHSTLPIVACMTVNEEGANLLGAPAEVFVPQLDAMDVQVIGLNCSVGPKVMLDMIPALQQYSQKPLIIQPNAGHPRVYQDRTIYPCTPEYMASYTRKLLKAGVQMIGGCCGTTPAHIREMARSVRALKSMVRSQRVQALSLAPLTVAANITPVPMTEKSRLAQSLVTGRFVVSVELTPPKGCDPSEILAKARTLYDHGVDAINLPDGPRASSRMSNQILSILMYQQIGIEPIPHYCCRDRNLLGMQSDLLGMYAAGIRNLLLITGDPPKLGDYPDATAVFDIDAIGLTHLVRSLNHGVDLGKTALKQPTGYLIGVGANPYAIDLEREVERFRAKVEAGAEYAITQPVFDIDSFRRFLTRIESHRIPILAGIWPLASFRNAEFMRNEVPGVVIPDTIMQRMYAAEQQGTARQEGILIAQEMLVALQAELHGVQVSAPFGRIETALEVLQALPSRATPAL